MGLRDGEELAYSVNVRQHNQDEDEEQNPTAASSSDGNMVTGAAGQEAGIEGCSAAGLDHMSFLPVTGEHAPSMWNQPDRSAAHDFSVDDFMETPLGVKFYMEWKRGMVTDRLIGKRFGYGVLGRFYGKKDWESGTFQDQPDAAPEARVETAGEGESAPVCHRVAEGNGGGGAAVAAGLTGPSSPLATSMNAVVAAEITAGLEEDEGHASTVEEGESTLHGDHTAEGGSAGAAAAAAAAAVGLPGTSSGLTASTTERVADAVSDPTELRQTSLAHWLL